MNAKRRKKEKKKERRFKLNNLYELSARTYSKYLI